jgi:hypothetical protein
VVVLDPEVTLATVNNLKLGRWRVLVVREENVVAVGLPVTTTPWGLDSFLGGWFATMNFGSRASYRHWQPEGEGALLRTWEKPLIRAWEMNLVRLTK